MSQTIAELGEQGLLALLQSFCPPEVVGDDGALLMPEPGQALVVTTDVLVEGVHFSDRTTPPPSVGWRAAAANLSDLAAMGATPLGLTVGLSLPPHCAIHWVQQVYQGLGDCLSRYRCPLVGGDVSRSPLRSLAITAFGQVAPGCEIQRRTAQPGDAIVVSGCHGGSRAGLELLLNPPGSALSADELSLVNQHRYPQPRLDCLPRLNPLSRSGRISGMDSSDGLADAVLQICRASSVGAVLWAEQIPMPPAIANRWGREQALDWALYGGEDFELVLSLPEEEAIAFCRSVPGAGIVGTMRADSERVELVEGEGRSPRILSLNPGFQHF